MKKALILIAALGSSLHGEVTRDGVPFRDAATNESLTRKYREVSLENPMKRFPEATGEDASVVNRVGTLLENSEVITFNGQTTLVPKNAILQIPEKYADRINSGKTGVKIVGWLDFFSVNRGWISTVEVTFGQAKGDDPISPALMETLTKNGNVVIAVLKSGPISVLPPKAEKPAETPTQTAQVKP